MKTNSITLDYGIHKNPSFRNVAKASKKVLKPFVSEAIEASLASLSVLGASTLIANPRLIKLEESKIIGEYEMLETLNGKSRSFAAVDIDKENNFNIERDLLSNENVRSIYSKKGNKDKYNVSYRIFDENNNKLLDLKREFNVIDGNTTSSVINNNEYTNNFSLCFIETKSKTPYGVSSDNLILNWKFEDLMKQLPGEFFPIMKMYDVVLHEVDGDNAGNAFATTSSNICMSSDLKNNPFILAHELGHIISNNKNIEKNEELAKIYEQEKETLLESNNSLTISELSYFLSSYTGLRELVAEAFAIISGLGHDTNCLGARTLLLMQHFPRTIAKSVELLL